MGPAPGHLHDGRALPREVPGRPGRPCSATRSAPGSTSSPTATCTATTTWPGAPGTTTRLQRWAGFAGDYLQSEETRSPWLRYPPGTLLNEIYTGWRWPRVVDKIEHRPLDYAKIWRMAQSKTAQPVRFGTCCSQVMGLFLDLHTPKYKDQQRGDLGHGGGDEQGAAGAARRRLQVHPDRGADLHFWANTYGTRPREREVHDRGLQPRGAGPGRRGDLDPHLLGQPEHAARDRKRQLPRVLRALPRSSAAATCGRSK